MTEAEWNTSLAPLLMLAHLGSNVSERKWRLLLEAIGSGTPFPEDVPLSAEAMQLGIRGVLGVFEDDNSQVLKEVCAEYCSVLRDLFAPFRSVSLPPCDGGCDRGLFVRGSGEAFACRRCGGKGFLVSPTVLALARAAYASGNPMDQESLLVLADAVEEAGCQDRDMLMHLRRMEWVEIVNPWAPEAEQCSGWRPRPTPCYRGCHVVDAICGQE